MNKTDRDLLVMFNQEQMTPQAIEHAVKMLHVMLFSVEEMDNLINAHEIIDLNRYKVTNKYRTLQTIFKKQVLKPFEFLNCKN